MSDSIQTVLTSICPICHSGADSLHHIRPLSAGGTDEPRNKVWLCRRCHDIAETIYDETGMEYCPALVYHIRREFKLGGPVREPSMRRKHDSLKHRRPAFRFQEVRTEETGYPRRNDYPKTGTCAFCGREFERTKSNQAICQDCIRKNGKKSLAVLGWSIKADLKRIRALKYSWCLWMEKES